MENNKYENHQLYNKHLSYGGMRVNTSGTKPSAYITIIKLKNVLKELSDMDIEEILDEEMTPSKVTKQRNRLIKKIENMHYWQLVSALNILLTEGRIESITYVAYCKGSDKEPS